MSYGSRWHAGCDGEWLDVFDDDGSGGHDASVAERDAGQDDGGGADPDVGFDRDGRAGVSL
jgi:hypothetical protein